MNCLVITSICLMLSIVSINFCSVSGSEAEQSDGGRIFSSVISSESLEKEWRNKKIGEKQITQNDTTEEVIQGRSLHQKPRKNRKRPTQSSDDFEDRTRNGSNILRELNYEQTDGIWTNGYHEATQSMKNLQLSETVNVVHVKRQKRAQQFRRVSTRQHRRRHSRKHSKEIKSLLSELDRVIADLDEMAKNEAELKKELNEFRKSSHIKELQSEHGSHQGKNKRRRLEIYRPQEEINRHNTMRNEMGQKFLKLQAEGTTETFDLFEGNARSLMEHLEDQEVAKERKLREEIKYIRKKIGQVLGKNRELRISNKELRRQLCESMKQQKRREIHGADIFPYECRKLLRRKGMERQEKENPHPDSSRFISDMRDESGKMKSGFEDSEYDQEGNTGLGTKGRKVNKRNRKGKNFRIGGQKDGGNLEHLYAREKESEFGDSSFDAEGAQSNIRDKRKEITERKFSSTAMSRENEKKRSEKFSKLLSGEKVVAVLTTDGEKNFVKTENSEVSQDEVLSEEEEEANFRISTTEEDKEKVFDHIAAVDDAIFCDKPQPVVVYPSDEYPVPNKYYTPQGTLLHRCGNHSGCCPNEHLTCVPAEKETVVLHFFAAVLEESTSAVPHVEKLHFTNHTKCGCVFKQHAHLYL